MNVYAFFLMTGAFPVYANDAVLEWQEPKCKAHRFKEMFVPMWEEDFNLPNASVPFLLPWIKVHPGIRKAILRSFASADDPSFIPYVVESISRERDKQVVERAIVCLHMLSRHPAAGKGVPQLIKLLNRETDKQVLRKALACLGSLRSLYADCFEDLDKSFISGVLL